MQTQNTQCSICYNCYEFDQIDKLRLHEICYTCWLEHIKVIITRVTYKTGQNIMSPFQGGQSIDICCALNSLKDEHKLDLEEWLFKKYTTFTPDIEKCPQQTCNYVFTMQNCRWGPRRDANCPKCSAPLFIANSTKSILGSLYFLLFASQCPKCEIPIEKISGCPHMTCACKHEFCWYCLKDYRQTYENVYTTHQARQCVFIAFIKIFLVIMYLLGIILVFNGENGFQSFRAWFGIIFSILWRAVTLDIVVGLQILATSFVLSARNRYGPRGFLSNVNKPKYFTFLIILNCILIIFLYFFNELWVWFSILIGELCLIGLCALTVFLIIYSIETWFNYIA